MTSEAGQVVTDVEVYEEIIPLSESVCLLTDAPTDTTMSLAWSETEEQVEGVMTCNSGYKFQGLSICDYSGEENRPKFPRVTFPKII